MITDHQATKTFYNGEVKVASIDMSDECQSDNCSTCSSVEAHQTHLRLYAEYIDLCGDIGTCEDVMETVWSEYEQLNRSNVIDGNHLHWLACVTFLLSRAKSMKYPLPQLHAPCCSVHRSSAEYDQTIPSVSTLLKTMKLEKVRFSELCHRRIQLQIQSSDEGNTASIKWVIAPDTNQAALPNKLDICWTIDKVECEHLCDLVDRLEGSHQVIVVLAQQFPEIFSSVFDVEHYMYQDYKKFTWILFCWLNGRLFKVGSHLVSKFHLLLAVHEYIFCSALEANHIGLIRSELESAATVDVLNALCSRFQATTHIARQLLDQSILPEIEDLRRTLNPRLQLPLTKSLNENYRALVNQYELILDSEDRFDERMALSKVDHMVTSAVSCHSTPSPLVRVRQLSVDSRTCRRHRLHGSDSTTVVSQTPVNYAPWSCCDGDSGYDDEAGVLLSVILSHYTESRHSLIQDLGLTKVDQLENMFTNKYRQHLNSNDDVKRVVKLCVVSLAGILSNNAHDSIESQTEEYKDTLLETWLPDSLFEICAMIMLFCQFRESQLNPETYYGEIASSESGILAWSGQTSPAYYALRIIEPLIQALTELGLSKDVISFLMKIEERYVESKALVENSPIWDQISKLKHLPSSSDLARDEIQEYINGVSSFDPTRFRKLSRCTVSRTENSSWVTETDRVVPNSGLWIYLCKLHKLAASRLDELCDKLEIVDDNKRFCWYLFQHIVTTDLMVLHGKHIDQILMCCVYTISKISRQINVSFERLIKGYRLIRRDADTRIFRKVTPIRDKLMGQNQGQEPCSTVSSTSSSHEMSEDGQLERTAVDSAPDQDASVLLSQVYQSEYINIVEFYNQYFIPRYKSFILSLANQVATLVATEFEYIPHEWRMPKPTDSPLRLSPRYKVFMKDDDISSASFTLSPASRRAMYRCRTTIALSTHEEGHELQRVQADTTKRKAEDETCRAEIPNRKRSHSFGRECEDTQSDDRQQCSTDLEHDMPSSCRKRSRVASDVNNSDRVAEETNRVSVKPETGHQTTHGVAENTAASSDGRKNRKRTINIPNEGLRRSKRNKTCK